MRMNIITYCVLSLSLWSCKDKECPAPPPGGEDTSPIIWQAELSKTGTPSRVLVYRDVAIVGHEVDAGFEVVGLNKLTGDTIWSQNINPVGSFWPGDEKEFLIYEDKLVLSSGRSYYMLEAATGHVVWGERMEEAENDVTVIDGYLYKSDEISKSNSTLFRFDINSGNKEELFTIRKGDYNTETYSPRLRMPVKWIHPSGDEILVLQNRTFNWAGVGQQEPADASRMDILGYNLTADTMLWYRKGLAKISSVATPVIDGDKVYFYGGSKVHCIHPATGEDIWEFQVGGSNALEFVGSNILLHGDMLIAKPASRAMYALDKETGQQIWYSPATMSSPSAMTIVSDTVYFTGYYVNGVDVNTGELVVQYTSPESRGFYNGVGINPDNGYIYASDGVYLYCLDPKKMKK